MPDNDRVERLLIYRLEELARAVERSGAPPDRVMRLLELASVATMHAVALDFLSAERAAAIWQQARERHPALEEAEPRVPVAA